MNIRFAAAALALGALFATAVLPSASAEESLDGKATVDAKLDSASKKLTLVIKGAGDGVYVNTEYSLKCSLKAKDGGALEKAELKKDDAKFEDAGKAGKAKSATLTASADKSVEGSCKVVVCTDTSCSNPFKVPFSSN
jgi:hypothetical protein